MSFEFVNHRGEKIIPAGPSPSYTAQPRQRAEGVAKWHKGWSVEGHPPGSIERAQQAAEKALSDWASLSPEGRADAEKNGQRAPRAWDESVWRDTAKLARVRARPFEVPEAAAQCKTLAERAGWIDVRVIELKRG